MSIVELTKDSFQDAITPDGTLIVDFWRPGAAPAAASRPCSSRLPPSIPT